MQAFSYVSLATPFPGGGQEGETDPCQTAYKLRSLSGDPEGHGPRP